MEYIYIPKGVCASKMTFDIEGDIIKSYKVEQGCSGNSLGIGKLLEDQRVGDIIQKLSGVRCGFRRTSCPDQIAEALKAYQEKRNK